MGLGWTFQRDLRKNSRGIPERLRATEIISRHSRGTSPQANWELPQYCSPRTLPAGAGLDSQPRPVAECGFLPHTPVRSPPPRASSLKPSPALACSARRLCLCYAFCVLYVRESARPVGYLTYDRRHLVLRARAYSFAHLISFRAGGPPSLHHSSCPSLVIGILIPHTAVTHTCGINPTRCIFSRRMRMCVSSRRACACGSRADCLAFFPHSLFVSVYLMCV
jgi:hypothetical protein